MSHKVTFLLHVCLIIPLNTISPEEIPLNEEGILNRGFPLEFAMGECLLT